MSKEINEDPICKVCGEVMDAYCKDFWVCDCGNEAFITFGDESRTIIQKCECEPGEIVDDDDDRPSCCRICDSDMYPLCIDGCPTIDD